MLTSTLCLSPTGTDWAVVTDPSSAAAAVPKPAVRVPKAPVVVDQAQLDAAYYQKALPPKRPGVPRMAPTGDAAAVSQAKKKKDEVCHYFLHSIPYLVCAKPIVS